MNDDVSLDEVRAEPRHRGRGAHGARGVPVRGWKDVVVRVAGEVKADAVSLLAAGVAFFALLALVPTLVALVSIYGLVADPEDIQNTVDDTLNAAPTEVQNLVSSQLDSIVQSSSSSLRLGAVAGLAVALWSASSGMKNPMGALTVAYNESEERTFLRLRGVALGLTLAGIVLVCLLAAGLVAPNALGDSGATATVRSALLIARWPVAGAIAIVALTLLYRWAPDRRSGRWRWTLPGAVLAAVVWLAASIGFSFYTSNFGTYNETYGALGAIVVVMLWLFISAFAVILGAELNCELERQTAVDSTVGHERPLGVRDAAAADTLGRPTT
jgi:membrane protein